VNVTWPLCARETSVFSQVYLGDAISGITGRDNGGWINMDEHRACVRNMKREGEKKEKKEF
jgi:hypothetical protein